MPPQSICDATGQRQRQFVLLDGELVVEVDKFKYFGLRLFLNGRCTEEIKSRTKFTLVCNPTFARGLKNGCVEEEVFTMRWYVQRGDVVNASRQ